MRTNMQVSEGGRTDIGSRQGRIQETRRRWRSRWAVQNANERIVLATSGTLKRERKRTYITWRGVSIDPEIHYRNLVTVGSIRDGEMSFVDSHRVTLLITSVNRERSHFRPRSGDPMPTSSEQRNMELMQTLDDASRSVSASSLWGCESDTHCSSSRSFTARERHTLSNPFPRARRVTQRSLL
jgi:hypothetical protein